MVLGFFGIPYTLRLKLLICILYGVYKKKVIELWSALACSLYNLQKSFFQRRKKQAFSFRMSPFFLKFEEKLSKHESNKNCPSKLHISTSEHYYGSE